MPPKQHQCKAFEQSCPRRKTSYWCITLWAQGVRSYMFLCPSRAPSLDYNYKVTPSVAVTVYPIYCMGWAGGSFQVSTTLVAEIEAGVYALFLQYKLHWNVCRHNCSTSQLQPDYISISSLPSSSSAVPGRLTFGLTSSPPSSSVEKDKSWLLIPFIRCQTPILNLL